MTAARRGSTHRLWPVLHSRLDSHNEIITLLNGAAVHPTDVVLV
jgi:hypothetical protein